ncbi:MAG: hypothetical protein LBP22_11560 [Deltaproteobacteria bacterium]|nr:hypothetical protein [Deltaproteobacteria bacterium]
MEVKARNELALARVMAADPLKSENAVRHYFQAMNWYAPWGASQNAAEELAALGQKYNQTGNKDLAYSAFLRLRAGLMAARSFYLPRRELFNQANEFLASYLTDRKLEVSGNQGNRDDLYSYYFKVYSAGVNFSEFFALIVAVSFLGWIASFIKIIGVFTSNKNILTVKDRYFRARIAICLFLICYLAWVLSMTAA